VLKPADSTCYGGCAGTYLGKPAAARVHTLPQLEAKTAKCSAMTNGCLLTKWPEPAFVTHTDASFFETVGLYFLGDPRFLDMNMSSSGV